MLFRVFTLRNANKVRGCWPGVLIPPLTGTFLVGSYWAGIPQYGRLWSCAVFLNLASLPFPRSHSSQILLHQFVSPFRHDPGSKQLLSTCWNPGSFPGSAYDPSSLALCSIKRASRALRSWECIDSLAAYHCFKNGESVILAFFFCLFLSPPVKQLSKALRLDRTCEPSFCVKSTSRTRLHFFFFGDDQGELLSSIFQMYRGF